LGIKERGVVRISTGEPGVAGSKSESGSLLFKERDLRGTRVEIRKKKNLLSLKRREKDRL